MSYTTARISNWQFLLLIATAQTLENVKHFEYFGKTIASDERCTKEIKSRTAMAKAAFNKKKGLFGQQSGLKFKKETSRVLQLGHSFVWCCNWDIRKVRRSVIPGKF